MRVHEISKGSIVSADMNINVGKTEYIHVRRQEKVELPTTVEADKVCKFKCEYLVCEWVFGSREMYHTKCKHRSTFEVETMLDHHTKILSVGLGKTAFATKWKDYDQVETL